MPVCDAELNFHKLRVFWTIKDVKDDTKRGCANFKYVARNQHLEEELKYISELNWILCKSKRERHAQLRLEVSHTGLQNLPEGHHSFWQIFSEIGALYCHVFK